MTGLGLDFILKTQFTKEAGSRAGEGVPQIAVVITDGQSQDEVGPPSDDLRRRGIVLYAIGIRDADIEQLRKIGSEPHNQHVYMVSDFSALQGFADVFLLVDSSIKQQTLVKNLLTQLQNQLKISIDNNHMGLAQFSDDVNVEFYLNQYKSKRDILQKIKSFRLKPGDLRRIGAALDYARTKLLTPETGGRLYPGFRQYLVLMVAGGSDDSVYRQSQLLRDQGVTVITVGFDNADPMEMQIIATKPSLSKTMGNTDQIIQDIRTNVETSGELNVANECEQSTVSDIVFIVDQSIATDREEFQIVLNFLYNILAGLDISSNKVRVGVVLYGDEPKAEIYFNTHRNKENILHHIKKLPYVNTTTADTRKALLFVKSDVLTTKRGSRFMTAVPQVAVVITTGHSTSDVRGAAVELQRFGPGLKVFAVGVKNMNLKGLEHIVSYPMPTFLFTVEELANLVSIQKYVRTSICHVTVNPQSRKRPLYPGTSGVGVPGITLIRTEPLKTGCFKTEQVDLYFLVDQSSSIQQPEFEEMKKFIQEFLNVFQIGPNQVRVGLVKFSDTAEIQFNLVDTTDKAAIEHTVQGLFLDGGNTFMGKALQKMQELFQQAKENRTDPDIPRILIIITDGESTDEVAKPAAELRDQGVDIYAIGVKDAKESELLEISCEKSRTFSLSSFDALSTTEDAIVQQMCSRKACKDVRADVIALVESSAMISPADFHNMTHFIKFLMDQFELGPDAVRMGLVQYGTEPKLLFRLSGDNKHDMITKIDASMVEVGGGTAETGKALRYVSQLFDPSKGLGGRPGVPHILVVVSQGKATDAAAAADVADAAERLKGQGVLIYAVGISNEENREDTFILGSGVSNKRFLLEDFSELQAKSEQIGADICHF
ncbi:collagen alpha-4(VI) chain-like [Engraulis encrasicolus]|uniref:collagen alpha-4(VI) chain-like n=1 Tax=Engraulis encrasicolus TaxID=184585 RepID=UPI002FD764E1